MNFNSIVSQALAPHLEETLSRTEIEGLLEKPKSADHGDVSFPTFQLAKTFKKAPAEIAASLVDDIQAEGVDRVEAVGPYLNFFMDRDQVGSQLVQKILDEGPDFGSGDSGAGKTVPIDMSSPNIAKPMSMGHLRSTVIGNALSEIYQKLGYEVVKINYLGDWGTQFGKLITAYTKWGDEEKVRAHPIEELNKLYVYFHERAEEEPELEDEAREWFRKLEAGDEEATGLWKWFREESLKAFQEVYDRLHIDFDSYNGEAYYNDKMEPVIQDLRDQGLLVEDQGAQVVPLEEYDLNPALIMKKDGATLYITRDLAAVHDRKETYDFDSVLYVVGQDQKYHFRQLKAVLDKMGRDWAEDVHHIDFGLISVGGEKMSTRKGHVVLLEDVLDEAVEKATSQINEKNPDLENKEEVANQVGIGAVIFYDLQNDRTNNYDFNLDQIVQFEGETGPYVQYSRARAMSILRKAADQGLTPDPKGQLSDDYSWALIKGMEAFPQAIERAHRENQPAVIARFALDLASDFNKYYAHVKVLEDHPEQGARLALVQAVTVVLKEALRLLGVPAPDEM